MKVFLTFLGRSLLVFTEHFSEHAPCYAESYCKKEVLLTQRVSDFFCQILT